MIPHPTKVDKGGEDAYFEALDGKAIGIADGKQSNKSHPNIQCDYRSWWLANAWSGSKVCPNLLFF